MTRLAKENDVVPGGSLTRLATETYVEANSAPIDIYTVDTVPDPTAHVGEVIYVSDAPEPDRFAISESGQWRHVEGSTLNSFGEGPDWIHYEDFSVDSSAQYTWFIGASPLPWDGTDLRLEQTQNVHDGVYRSGWNVGVDKAVRLRGKIGPAIPDGGAPTRTNGLAIVLANPPYGLGNDHIYGAIGTMWYSGGNVNGLYMPGGASAPLAAVGGGSWAPSPDTEYVLEIRRSNGGGGYTFNVYADDGMTLLATSSELSFFEGTGAPTYGAYSDGQILKPGFRYDAANAAGPWGHISEFGVAN